jgi:transposase-like protein
MEVQDSGTLAGANGAAPRPRAARGRWTAQQRREILEASMVEGAVIGEVADRYGVQAALIGSWRRQLDRQSVRGAGAKSAPHFAEVRVDRVGTEGVIEIDLTNRCIRVRGIVDAAMLREVFAATR